MNTNNQTIDWATDEELNSELIRRCQLRLERPTTSTVDRKLLAFLYDIGKLLLTK